MVMTSSTSDSKPRMNEEAPSEKLGDSSIVWEDPVESRSPKEGEGEEEEECGLCLFMKEGDCKDSFTAWEVCVEEAKKKKEDFVPKCREVSTTLYKCMVAHSDYYEPIFTAEKAVKMVMEAEKNKVEEEEEVAARKLAQVVD